MTASGAAATKAANARSLKNNMLTTVKENKTSDEKGCESVRVGYVAGRKE